MSYWQILRWAHCQRQVAFLSPPVHFAQWAHMRRFLSVCQYGLGQKSDWTIIHISKSKTNFFPTDRTKEFLECYMKR